MDRNCTGAAERRHSRRPKIIDQRRNQSRNPIGDGEGPPDVEGTRKRGLDMNSTWSGKKLSKTILKVRTGMLPELPQRSHGLSQCKEKKPIKLWMWG